MHSYKRRLNCFIVIAVITNFIVNSFANTPIDIISLVIVGLMLVRMISWSYLLVLCCISDCINFSPLGSHLLATVIISYSTDQLYNYFWVGSNLQKFICILIHSVFLILIICGVEIMVSNINYTLLGVFEIFLFLPIWLYMLNNAMNVKSNSVY